MTDRLTWGEVSSLKPGALVAFGESYGIGSAFGPLDVPPGVVCEVVENSIYIGGSYGGIVVRPVDPTDREPLIYMQEAFNGSILLEEAYPEELSPLVLDDSCPVECI